MTSNLLVKKILYLIEYFFHLLQRIRSKIYTLLLRPLFFKVGIKVTISPPFRYFNLSQIQIGSYVTIHSNCWIHVLKGDDGQTSPKLIIGDCAAIGMDATISAAEEIIIEEHVIIARNVYISDHGHEFHDISIPVACQGIRKKAPVTIGRHSWIGQNVVILPGVTIGRHCVVGANSVVTKDIPDYSVSAGSPAQIIERYNPASGTWEKVR